MSWFRSVFKPFRAIAWKSIKALIRQKFLIPNLSTAQLAEWIAKDTSPFVLIDTRQKEEYDLSHLPHAYHAENLAQSKAVIAAADPSKKAPVVLYCSIGYRSARLGSELRSAGYEAMNLEGSIFQWANEGRSLVSKDQPTRQVHPYNSFWGLLLNSHD
jgi:rhodanese-related sulfurtransferase